MSTALSDLVTQEHLLIQFAPHPQERDLIGRIILAYGEIEFMLMDALRATLNNDTMAAVRTLYRLRSESNRLQITDALVRPKLAEHGLVKDWDEAVAAITLCKNIRNQYTHSRWITESGTLRFGDLDAAAKGNAETTRIRFRPINAALLRKQLAYFTYADHLLVWIADQYRLKNDLERSIPEHIPKPKRVPRVSSDNREEAHSRQSRSKAPKPQRK